MKNFSSYLKELELPLNDDFKEPQKLFKKPSKSLEVLKEITQTFPVLDNTLYEFSVKDHHSLFLNRIGVVFSGGQASGGHNVIYGLWEALKKANPNVELVGFLDGPSGIIENRFKFLDDETMANFKNTGGFDLLGSGRTKIETLEQKSCAVSTIKAHRIEALVIIGGDDSNTNACVLAQHFLENHIDCTVVGVPKTIDGDLKNSYVSVSFGFDSATKLFSQLAGNIQRDALSAKKYSHFIKIMGRSASHLALETALLAQPNLTLIIEEFLDKKWGIKEAVSQIADLIDQRAKVGKNYNVIIIPEGLIEAFFDVQKLLRALEALIKEYGPEKAPSKLDTENREVFETIPAYFRNQLLNETDPHGNIQVSLIETERLLAEMTREELKKRGSQAKFSPICHFFGYEGRCCYPTYFDALYAYYLGIGACVLVQNKLSGYMVAIDKLEEDYIQWQLKALPIISLMHMETRKGTLKPVIKKALVNLGADRFKIFEKTRKTWAIEDHYQFCLPTQYFGPKELVFQPPLLISDKP